MKPLLPALLLSFGFSTAAVSPAAAYPVDCAILLCLAGGWPASAECAHARAVFIRRITPWPIEPPLQIWNCPMRVGFRGDPQPVERLFDIALRREVAPTASVPEAPIEFQLVQDRADVDISDPAFDFVRSIRVFEITYQQDRDNDDHGCSRSAQIFSSTYGEQGNYIRKRSNLTAVPKASNLKVPENCNPYRHRSVFVEWQDYRGSYDYEEVSY